MWSPPHRDYSECASTLVAEPYNFVQVPETALAMDLISQFYDMAQVGFDVRFTGKPLPLEPSWLCHLSRYPTNKGCERAFLRHAQVVLFDSFDCQEQRYVTGSTDTPTPII